MEPDAPLDRLGVALAIGLLVGAERHWRERDAEAGHRTTGLRSFAILGLFGGVAALAALATVARGALAAIGEPGMAGAAAVARTAVLASRERLPGLMARITWAEMRSAILLLSMPLVALPLVPDAPIAALGGVNPAQVRRLAILLAAIAFAGYLAMRLVGAKRGLLVSGAVGGLFVVGPLVAGVPLPLAPASLPYSAAALPLALSSLAALRR